MKFTLCFISILYLNLALNQVKLEYPDSDSIKTEDFTLLLHNVIAHKTNYCKVGVKLFNNSAYSYLVIPEENYLLAEQDTFRTETSRFVARPKKGKGGTFVYRGKDNFDYRFPEFNVVMDGIYKIDSSGTDCILPDFTMSGKDSLISTENLSIEIQYQKRNKARLFLIIKVTNHDDIPCFFDPDEVTYHLSNGSNQFKYENTERDKNVLLLKNESEFIRLYMLVPETFSDEQIYNGVYKWNKAFTHRTMTKTNKIIVNFKKN